MNSPALFVSLMVGLAAPPSQTLPATCALTVDVTVTDQQTGQPVSGAQITLNAFPSDTPHQSTDVKARTDDSGRASLALPDRPLASAVFMARSPGRVPVVAQWFSETGDPVALPLELALEMREGTRVGGLVVGEDGRPAAGARVELFVEPKGGHPRTHKGEPLPYCWRVPVFADAQGRWSCDEAPAEWESFFVELKHPDYVNTAHLTELFPPEVLREGTVETVMFIGRRLAGRVVDAEGRPVTGGEVRYTPLVGRSPGNGDSDAPVRTDDAGRFEFPHASTGALSVMVTAEGQPHTLWEFSRTDAVDNLQLKLERPRQVTLRVTNQSGDPARALVGLEKLGDKSVATLWTTLGTTRGGMLHINLPRQPATLVVYTGRARQRVEIEAEQSQLTVTLETGK